LHAFRNDISNCLFEAALQEVERQCGCAPSSFIDRVPHVPTCIGKAIKCMNKIRQAMGDYRYIVDVRDGKRKVCLEYYDLSRLQQGALWTK